MKNQKINHDKVSKKLIGRREREAIKPKILLHSCCAPCGTYTLELLTQRTDITTYFADSGIYPKNEYLRHTKVQEQFVEDSSRKTDANMKHIETSYESHKFIEMMKGKELADEREGSSCCTAYFEMRLNIVTKATVEYDYDYFDSVITLSPKKNAQLTNELGMDIRKIYDANCLPSDFRKGKGYERPVEMCNDYNIFRQCYCGCVFAAMRQGINSKTANKEAKAFLEQYPD